MRLATKTLESLLTATGAIVTVPKTAVKQGAKLWLRLDRILQRHDRKGELRASIFGISAQEFRELQKKFTFEQLVRQFGFPDLHGYCKALLGKLKDELRQKGWSQRRIDQFLSSRVARFAM